MRDSDGRPVTNIRVRLAINMIADEHSNAELSLDLVAQRLRITPCHLCHLIKQETGHGFRKHLRDIRLAAARQHLEAGVLSVKEVASVVGFNSTSSFDREFRRRHGCTPTEWRRLQFELSTV